ncbi:MAG: alpha-amylase family glycosyl hydrolase [Gaiellaceae bacterium]
MFLTLCLQDVLHYSAMQSGAAFAAFAVTVVVASNVVQVVVGRFGVRPTLTAGLVASAVSVAALTRLAIDGPYFRDLFRWFVLSGACMAASPRSLRRCCSKARSIAPTVALPMATPPQPWWSGGVLYQAYPRSFADSNGDGIGDLAGLRGRLDYLSWLGVDGIWLNPTFPSPNRDWGYDVSDYLDVHPDLGTLGDLDALIAAASERRIRILLDLVPAHTSDRHQWFAESRASRESPRRSWYIWREKAEGQESVFGGKAWTYDERTGQFYHHLFLPEQPDLNWLQPDVRDAFEEILRFWFDRGVAGFRIDVVHELVKDPPSRTNRPKIHDVLRRWRSLAAGYEPQRLFVGETWVMDLEELASFYGSNDELQLAFNFPFMFAGLDAAALAAVVKRTEAVLPDGALPVWALSNHDVVRFPTRMCDEDDAKVRAALLALLTLRGTSVLYYGDELGMGQVDIPPERVRDVHDRDGARTPLPWGDVDWRNPWLPLGANVATVAEQRSDPRSVLSFCREAIALRHGREDLVSGGYTPLASPTGVWAWRRGSGTVIALNLTGSEAILPLAGEVILSTNGRDDASRLEPWEGVVVALT